MCLMLDLFLWGHLSCDCDISCSFIESFVHHVFEQQILFWADFLSMTQALWFMIEGGAGGQNLGHL